MAILRKCLHDHHGVLLNAYIDSSLDSQIQGSFPYFKPPTIQNDVSGTLFRLIILSTLALQGDLDMGDSVGDLFVGILRDPVLQANTQTLGSILRRCLAIHELVAVYYPRLKTLSRYPPVTVRTYQGSTTLHYTALHYSTGHKAAAVTS
ncbi:hypothetical protein J6590_085096 [Homalodisca vitripennis]|nr:hypothetical protein J6590_085096 [Homalodisca vitripennis]